MKSSLFESLTIPQNTIINPCDIQQLKDARNMKCLTINKAIFNNFKLSDLQIQNSLEIKYLELQGSTGLKVLPTAQPAQLGTYNAPVPFSWANLTMVGIMNLRDMGLTPQYMDNLIIGLSQVIPLGLGSASTVKKIYLDGNNSAPTATSATQLAQLQSLGWTVYHSDMTKAAEMEQSPCCAGDCVDCGGTPILPTLITVNVALAGAMDNGQLEIVTVNVPGLVLGGNNNVQLATDISALVTSGLVITHNIVANDTLNVTIENQTGNDGLTVPTLQYNIYVI